MKRFLFECLVAYHLHLEMKVINCYCEECFFVIKHSFVCDDPQSADPIFVSKSQNVCIGRLECKKRDLIQRSGDHFFGWGSGGTACST